MPLPKDFVKRGLERAKDATLYGVRIDDMSHDELIAAVAHGWRQASITPEPLQIKVKLGFIRNIWMRICTWLDLATRQERDRRLSISQDEFDKMEPVNRALFIANGGWIDKQHTS